SMWRKSKKSSDYSKRISGLPESPPCARTNRCGPSPAGNEVLRIESAREVLYRHDVGLRQICLELPLNLLEVAGSFLLLLLVGAAELGDDLLSDIQHCLVIDSILIGRALIAFECADLLVVARRDGARENP